MTTKESRTITDRIDYIMPYVTDKRVADELKDIKFQCECMVKNKGVTAKEFKPDYSKDCEIACAIQLDLAIELFVKMIDELGISNQEFLAQLMYVYDLEPEDVYVAENEQCI